MSILDRALRLGEARQFKQYAKRVDRINAWEPELELLDDDELRANADSLRERARGGEPLEDLLPETFALVREVSKRTMAMRHFDVQMIGGMVLHDGAIAEMKTGEGARLAPVPPLVAVALDLPGQLVRDEVDRVLGVPRGVLGAEGRALEVQGRLGHHLLRVGGVAFLVQLDIELGQLADLLADLLEAPRHYLAQLVGDLKVASLDLDPHGDSSRWMGSVSSGC